MPWPLALAGGSSAIAQTAPEGETTAQAPAAAIGVGEGAELAKELSNPVASLVSVPFQLNWDEGLGPDGEGRRFLLNFQPVMPFKLNDDWNLIARVIVPVLAQPVLFEGGQLGGRERPEVDGSHQHDGVQGGPLLGRRPISIQAGPRFCLESPAGGPSWGFRTALTLIFPAG